MKQWEPKESQEARTRGNLLWLLSRGWVCMYVCVCVPVCSCLMCINFDLSSLAAREFLPACILSAQVLASNHEEIHAELCGSSFLPLPREREIEMKKIHRIGSRDTRWAPRWEKGKKPEKKSLNLLKQNGGCFAAGSKEVLQITGAFLAGFHILSPKSHPSHPPHLPDHASQTKR